MRKTRTSTADALARLAARARPSRAPRPSLHEVFDALLQLLNALADLALHPLEGHQQRTTDLLAGAGLEPGGPGLAGEASRSLLCVVVGGKRAAVHLRRALH